MRMYIGSKYQVLISYQYWPWKKRYCSLAARISLSVVYKILKNGLHKFQEVTSSHSLLYSIQESQNIQRN